MVASTSLKEPPALMSHHALVELHHDTRGHHAERWRHRQMTAEGLLQHMYACACVQRSGVCNAVSPPSLPHDHPPNRPLIHCLAWQDKRPRAAAAGELSQAALCKEQPTEPS